MYIFDAEVNAEHFVNDEFLDEIKSSKFSLKQLEAIEIEISNRFGSVAAKKFVNFAC
jgi:hypothetical protein